MSDNENQNIQSVELTPLGNVNGVIGAGSLVVNDYQISLEDVEGGYDLSVTKGSQTQTAFIRQPVGIARIYSNQSVPDTGMRTITIVMTDGRMYGYTVQEGKKGDKGDPGLTLQEKQTIIHAENERISAEATRAENELARNSSEENRQLFETIRRGEEAERVQQEKNRVSAETARVSAENARVAAENARKQNENERNQIAVERYLDWQDLKTQFNAAINTITLQQGEIDQVSNRVDVAADDVVEAIVAVNNEIARAETILDQVEEASGDIINLAVNATTLSPNSQATASYSNGTLTIGVPKGNTGDSFHIVKTYLSIYEMNADYYGSDTHIGDFVMIASTVEDPDNAKVYVKADSQFVFVVDMSGATGIKGDKGDPGNDGFSPYINVTNISGGHSVTITDSRSIKAFNVVDGVDGESVTSVAFQIGDDGFLQYKVTIG